MYDSWWFETGQAFFQAAAFEEEFLMVQTQQMQDRGMKVVNADRVFNDAVAEIVRLAVARPAFDASAGHPRGEGLHVVVPA